MSSLEKINRQIQALMSVALQVNVWLLLLLFWLITYIFIFVKSEYVITDRLFDQHAEELRQEKYDNYDELATEFDEDLEEAKDLEEAPYLEPLISFGLTIVQYTLQFVIIAAFIYGGLVITSTAHITYSTIFKLAVISEYIFFIPKGIKYAWYVFTNQTYTYTDVQNFTSFSLYDIFKSFELASWIKYPLKVINLFEVLYLFLFIAGAAVFYNVPLKEVRRPIIFFYCILIFLWVSVRIYIDSIF